MRFLHTISVAVTALISTAAAVGDCDQGPFETKGVGYGGGVSFVFYFRPPDS